MAEKTIKVYANQGVHVNDRDDAWESSSWHLITTPTYQTRTYRETVKRVVSDIAAFKFDSGAVSRKRLKSGTLVVYVTSMLDDYGGKVNHNVKITSLEVDFSNPQVDGNSSFYTLFQRDARNIHTSTGNNSLNLWQESSAWPEDFLEKALTCGVALYPGNSYGDAGSGMYVTVATHLHPTNKPYLEIVCEDIVPRVTGLSPNGGTVYRREATRFSWGFDFDRTNYNGTSLPADYIKQKSFIFRWRKVGSETYTEITGGSSQYIEIPANTFELGGIEYQVVVTSDDGISSEPSPWIALEVGDTLSTPQAISPSGIIIDGSKEQVFTWRHIIYTGTPQTRFTLQYKTEESVWKSLADEKTSRENYTVPANALPAGSLRWRVQTYNTEGKPGDWSNSAAIIVKYAPSQPVISFVDNKPLPSIKWQAQGQQAFQVKAGAYDSGTQYGTEKSFQIPCVFPDGQLDISLRVQNQFGLWSEWATATTVIANQEYSLPKLKVDVYNYGIRLQWTGDFAQVDIFRDGAFLDSVKGTSFLDYQAVGKHSYFVRGITEKGYYADSEIVKRSFLPGSSMIAATERWEWLPLVFRRGAHPEMNTSAQREIDMRFYSGRKKPVAEKSLFRQKTHSFEYSLKTREQVEKLMEMLGEQVVYKDKMGNVIYGTLTTADVLQDWAYNVSFTIVETEGGSSHVV